MLAAQIKEQLSLLEVAEHFQLPLKSGRQHCPFCDPGRSKSSSFVVNSEGSGHYYCYRCKADGDLFQFLIQAGLATDFRSAMALVTPLCSNNNTAVQARRSTLEQVFDCYIRAFRHYPEAREYAASRGIGFSMQEFPIGYAPHGQWLQENGFSWEEIESCGIATKRQGLELYQQRVIFPLRNTLGQLVHLQGRDVTGESDVKYLCSGYRGQVVEPNTSRLLFNADRLEKWRQQYGTVFLCEGVTDAYSLLEMGLPVVASIGNRPELTGFKQQFKGMHVIAMYDNDRWDLGTPDAGAYKSWPAVLPQLVKLQEITKVKIDCCVPPRRSGIKDVNQFVERIEYDQERFIEYVDRHKLPLFDFLVQEYGDNLDYAALILRAAQSSREPENLERVRELYAHNSFELLLNFSRVL